LADLERGSIVLVTGGVRSGKSTFAEKLALHSGKELIYLATAGVEDEEMLERVKHHQRNRSSLFKTIEEALKPHLVLDQESSPGKLILVDCLTMLITNLFMKDIDSNGAVRDGEDIYADEALLEEAAERTLDYIRFFRDRATACQADLIIVTNEVGMGVVPNYPVGRVFRDLAGRANQVLATAADQVWMVVCGLPQQFK